jgi:predicted Rossmann fold nucleotide-binding protein DprA/Smf involved in DNA uptake
MADFLDEKRREMHERLEELRPLVDEYHRLEAAVAALDGVGTQPAPGVAARRRRGGGGSGTTAGSGNGRRGRPRGSGTRGKQALELVRSSPGITIPEIAEQMGIQQNYLYRVLPALQKEGQIRKEGRGWHPMAAE